ncbi:hypothetical protein PHET_03176 [Paragonimus heterotremus]|uniref:Uncharacterized protein n=1 Tax=Paragonimus heterotremus TaxID=100268 RepID=A0A8J4WJF0_9TREM|nr:hypothetical protein PHET_03176 [Paragonimus heterotremus]
MHCTVFVFLYIFCAVGNAQDDWDYLMLSLRWPPTLCSFVECTPVPKPIDFVIHGLWPTTLPDEEPMHCAPAPPFDRDRLAMLLPQLNQFWPNLLPNTDAFQFWKHEWHDHGRCALEDPIIADIVDYFNQSLQLRSKCDLLGRLTSVNVLPSNQTEYTYEALVQVLHDIYGVRTKLYCLKRHHQTPHLFEIRICFNVNLDFIDCHDKHECGFSTDLVDTSSSCAATTRDLVGGGSTYSAMPCPNGPIIFPSFVNTD